MRVFVCSSLVALAAGCVAPSGDESFIIRQNLAPGEEGCTFSPSLTALTLARGQIFLDSPIPYLLHPMFESRIVAPEGRESLRTIQLKGARISLQIGPIERVDADGNVTLDDEPLEPIQFTSQFSAPLPPNGGLVSAQLDLVPLAALAEIRARIGDTTDRVHAAITGTITPFGDYYGEEIEGSPFLYPVTACNDCIVRSVFPACPVAIENEISLGNACNPFQDGVVDCCEDPALGLICPAPVAGPET